MRGYLEIGVLHLEEQGVGGHEAGGVDERSSAQGEAVLGKELQERDRGIGLQEEHGAAAPGEIGQEYACLGDVQVLLGAGEDDGRRDEFGVACHEEAAELGQGSGPEGVVVPEQRLDRQAVAFRILARIDRHRIAFRVAADEEDALLPDVVDHEERRDELLLTEDLGSRARLSADDQFGAAGIQTLDDDGRVLGNAVLDGDVGLELGVDFPVGEGVLGGAAAELAEKVFGVTPGGGALWRVRHHEDLEVDRLLQVLEDGDGLVGEDELLGRGGVDAKPSLWIRPVYEPEEEEVDDDGDADEGGEYCDGVDAVAAAPAEDGPADLSPGDGGVDEEKEAADSHDQVGSADEVAHEDVQDAAEEHGARSGD